MIPGIKRLGNNLLNQKYLDPTRNELIDNGLKSLIKWSIGREEGWPI